MLSKKKNFNTMHCLKELRTKQFDGKITDRCYLCYLHFKLSVLFAFFSPLYGLLFAFFVSFFMSFFPSEFCVQVFLVDGIKAHDIFFYL